MNNSTFFLIFAAWSLNTLFWTEIILLVLSLISALISSPLVSVFKSTWDFSIQKVVYISLEHANTKFKVVNIYLPQLSSFIYLNIFWCNNIFHGFTLFKFCLHLFCRALKCCSLGSLDGFTLGKHDGTDLGSPEVSTVVLFFVVLFCVVLVCFLLFCVVLFCVVIFHDNFFFLSSLY